MLIFLLSWPAFHDAGVLGKYYIFLSYPDRALWPGRIGVLYVAVAIITTSRLCRSQFIREETERDQLSRVSDCGWHWGDDSGLTSGSGCTRAVSWRSRRISRTALGAPKTTDRYAKRSFHQPLFRADPGDPGRLSRVPLVAGYIVLVERKVCWRTFSAARAHARRPATAGANHRRRTEAMFEGRIIPTDARSGSSGLRR